MALLDASSMKHFGVDRRIVVKPRIRGGYLRFDDQRITVLASTAAIAGKIADEVKHSRDWDGSAPLDPKVAW